MPPFQGVNSGTKQLTANIRCETLSHALCTQADGNMLAAAAAACPPVLAAAGVAFAAYSLVHGHGW